MDKFSDWRQRKSSSPSQDFPTFSLAKVEIIRHFSCFSTDLELQDYRDYENFTTARILNSRTSSKKYFGFPVRADKKFPISIDELGGTSSESNFARQFTLPIRLRWIRLCHWYYFPSLSERAPASDFSGFHYFKSVVRIPKQRRKCEGGGYTLVIPGIQVRSHCANAPDL
ncbi:hypothetical protein SCHPADRAFT_898662 [Schizopora paradoxa]|uniref:Uncharacterized protein n=1 Tax=Schizopora paradoxa TaxID=27342 RepID=A0A0H2SRK9_9AGAM|nr:hypothetical protein SCHPADRAFT_898662 [Schizopora paradoxa]